ncbi:YcjX family protein [Amphritea sp. 1_MG-2023]|uniref:YcjX family protein n=1 Tax=Amphritea sp. 1_MG-2023 TaxID=3062670 RepID=UPI0026E3C972|nr:YcjX family protein [Amphritea sp. 1_MG-2023]MDO6564640.1 YcjX family protein [Amphritea sp. 1_MG-2023]
MKDSDGFVSNIFKKPLKSVIHKAEEGVSSAAVQIEKLRDQRFCIGITGLSQSGKSTFITSLINQLQQHEAANLPGFSPVLTDRLLGVKIHPLDAPELPQFPYEAAYRGLTNSQPQWPASTVDISGCLLELRLENTASRLNPFRRQQFSLYLEIRDYPGEWLLDLPLREMSYARWCAQCSAQYTQPPRVELLGDLLDDLQHIDPLSEVDETHLQALHQRYVHFLNACKRNHLSLIQPGRFLLSGQIEDTEILCFVPLLNCGDYNAGQLNSAPKNSYYKVCQRRYQRYIKELVEPFYKKFFSRIDRQLVLVDIISALNAGPEYIDDMRQALANITDSFAYGRRHKLLQLFSPKIDKVIFAATKIDQVLSEDHEAVRQLLAVIVKQAYRNAQHEGIHPICEATAAVRSSKEIKHENQQGISGFGVEGTPIGYIHPRIPNRIPEGDEWRPFQEWKIPPLNPPKGISYQNNDAIPHIRIDSVLNALIGDKCI